MLARPFNSTATPRPLAALIGPIGPMGPIRRILLAATATIIWSALLGCSEKSYDQGTPEAAIASARQMIKEGHAEKLPALIYTETPEMKRLFNTTGKLFGDVEELAIELNKRFPKECQDLAARAELQAKEGKPTTLIGQLAQAAQRQRSKRRGPPSTEDRKAFDDAVTRFFADPYAFIRDSEDKLTTTPLGETQVALLWDKKMILPPIGMIMQQGEDGLWYFVPPTSLPGVKDFMPKTKEQFEIMGGLIAVFDKVVLDLTKEVKEGRLTSLELVSQRAGEMTFVPAVLTFYAYSELRKDQK